MSNKTRNMHKTREDSLKGLQRIYAPWRYKYFEEHKQAGCFICSGIAAGLSCDRANLILVRKPKGIILLNRYPYTVGALMIAPTEHLATIREVDDEVLLTLMHLVRCGIQILDTAIHPNGYNIGINQSAAAGAGLDDHLHIHIVPRWGGDTNFMTTIAETRVLSEDVDHMYERLSQVPERPADIATDKIPD